MNIRKYLSNDDFIHEFEWICSLRRQNNIIFFDIFWHRIQFSVVTVVTLSSMSI